MGIYNSHTELYHHGILGQKWGIRRYQNEDGTLTPEGEERYRNYSKKQRAQDRQMYSRGAERRIEKAINRGEGLKGARSREADRIEKYRQSARTNAKIGKVVGTVAGVAGVALGTYAINKVLGSPFADADLAVYRSLSIGSDTSYISIGKEQLLGILATAGVSAAAIGGSIGSKAGKYGTMAVGGYKPEKYR